jgi:hypothetical protein
MSFQRPLLAGVDCLPGQQDLFATDGELPPARNYCAACGEYLGLFWEDDAPPLVGSDNSPYCSAKCFGDGERELADLPK